MRNLKMFVCAALIGSLVVSCSKNDSKTLRIAASSIPHAELIEQIIPDLKQQGISVELITMNDYLLPNKLVDEKQIDANFFQHIPFLDYQKNMDHLQVEVLGKIHIEPMGLYSKKHTLKDISHKKIALPLDPSNEQRALKLLESEGLITLSGASDTIRDISSNPYHLEFIEMESAILPRVIQDVDFAVIPTNFALEAGLTPKDDALILESENSPYANIIAVHPENEKKEALLKLLQAMQSEKMQKYIQDSFKGAILPAF